MLVCLSILTGTFLVLTLYAIFQANKELLPVTFYRYLSIKILDAPSAATLFVTLIGALLVRHQYAVGLLPRINYKATNFTKTDTLNHKSYETWRVKIINSGLGAAIIDRTEYILELADTNGVNRTCNYQDIVSELAKIGLVFEQDFWMENIARGFSLSPKDDCFAFEIKTEYLPKIKHLDMKVYFKSQMSSKYWREIFFIPYRPTKTEKQSSV